MDPIGPLRQAPIDQDVLFTIDSSVNNIFNRMFDCIKDAYYYLTLWLCGRCLSDDESTSALIIEEGDVDQKMNGIVSIAHGVMLIPEEDDRATALSETLPSISSATGSKECNLPAGEEISPMPLSESLPDERFDIHQSVVQHVDVASPRDDSKLFVKEDDRAEFLQSITARLDQKIRTLLDRLFLQEQFTIQIDPKNTSHFFIDTKSKEIVKQDLKYKIMLISIKIGLISHSRLEGFIQEGINHDGYSYGRISFPNRGKRIHYDALGLSDSIEWITYIPTGDKLELKGDKRTITTAMHDVLTKLTVSR